MATPLETPGNLPLELVYEILYKSEAEEILNVCRTNRQLKAICQTPVFWANKALLDFGYPNQLFLNSQTGKALSPYEKYLVIREVLTENQGQKTFSYPDTDNNRVNPFKIEASLHYYTPDELVLGNAVEYGSPEIVQLLLSDPRIDPSVYHNYMLKDAINSTSVSDNDKIQIVRLLLSDPRVDPGDQDNGIIIRAAKVAPLAVVKMLVEDPRVYIFNRYGDILRAAKPATHRTTRHGRVELPRDPAREEVYQYLLGLDQSMYD